MKQFDEERCGNLTWEYHRVRHGAVRHALTEVVNTLGVQSEKLNISTQNSFSGFCLSELFEVTSTFRLETGRSIMIFIVTIDTFIFKIK